MTAYDPFDPRPDPRLGHLLREHLEAPDHAAFVARVRAALAVPAVSSWDVLAGWTRPGLAAAAALALAAGLWFARSGHLTPAADEPAVASGPAELVAAAQPPSVDGLLATALEGR